MRSLKFFCIICLTSFLASCGSTRYVYNASPPNNPYFKKKGESKLSAFYSNNRGSTVSNFEAGGIDLQAAYAFSNHWAINADYMYRSETDNFEDRTMPVYNVHYTRNVVTAGIGYFLPLDSAKKLIFNVYTGIGTGRFSIKDDGEYFKNDVLKWYVQPSLNFIPFENVNMGLVLKTSFVNYNRFNTNYSVTKQSAYSLDYLRNHTLIFLEPAIDCQVGMKAYPWIKLYFQVGPAYLLGSARDLNFDIRKNNYSIGLNFDITKLKTK